MKKTIALISLSLAVTGQAHAAGLLGKRIATQYFYPDLSQPYTPPSYTIVDERTITSFERNFNMLFSANSVEISFVTSTSWNEASFNGFKIWDADGTIDDFAASIASSNMTGLSKSNIRYDDNNIWVNWQGLGFNTGTKVTLNLFASAVPEPGTWALMLTGLALTGASLRRRTRHTAITMTLA